MERNYSVSKELLLDRELLLGLRDTTLKKKVVGAFELLRDPVYRYLFRVLDNPQEAEDLTQEVFLRFYTCLRKGQPVGNIRAWIFHVAHNLAVDQQRKKAPLQPFDSTDWDQIQDAAPSPDQKMLEDEQHKRLQQALDRLSLQEKHCLELRAEGLSYREISEILEMRLPTLVKYLGRIIKKLVREVTHD
jgi:RNA polymerase sigma-70 factor (ECF subfamily)